MDVDFNYLNSKFNIYTSKLSSKGKQQAYYEVLIRNPAGYETLLSWFDLIISQKNDLKNIRY